MELWSKITGTVTVELTAADPEYILGEIVKNDISLWDIQRQSALMVVFRTERTAFSQVQNITEQAGGTLRMLGLNGVYFRLKQWRKRPVLLGTMLLLFWASVYIPGRVLFVDVVGNETVPTKLIQETAAQFGLEFGASRRQVRSERIKNELLGAIKELEWVGVNTNGCSTTISVRERAQQPEESQEKICNLVASADGIVDRITLTRGTLLCAQGQAVRAGQILVSGLADLGICTRAVEAEAEIYALTMHEQRAVLPSETMIRQGESGTQIKISLQIGKKRINLYSDSGILLPTCGKMTQELKLRLPGGLTLPASLIVERYTQYEIQAKVRQENAAYTMLQDAARRQLIGSMVAGQILTERISTELTDNQCALVGSYECREMIARQDDGIYLEGDTQDDSENSERGEG